MIVALRIAPLFLAWLACFWLCREGAARGRIRPEWPVSWALASAGWGALLTWTVEVSSALGQLKPWTLFGIWCGLSAVLLLPALWLSRRRGLTWATALLQGRSFCQRQWAASPPDVILALGFTALLLLLLGSNAWEMVTNNSDSLSYHMARVMHWMQNQSVAHYPTNDFRQNEWAPWPAFVQVSLYLLHGGDRWANLPQWFAMLSCVVTAPWIAWELWQRWETRSGSAGAAAAEPQTRARVGACAAVLLVTLPIGVAQSVSTQTDYLCAGWLLWLMAFSLLLLREPRNIWYALGAAFALALGLLTKPTMFIYASPLIAALALALVRREKAGLLRLAIIFAVCVAAINAPHMWRNYSATGSLLSRPHTFLIECNKSISWSGTLSNMIRNLALETETGIAPLARVINGAIAAAHRVTGRSLNDPDTTYYMSRFEFVETSEVFDCQASNLLHLILLVTACGLAIATPGADWRMLLYPLLALAGLILFCALLRWNRWHSRFHLAWFVLTMPWVATVLVRRLSSPLLALLPFLLFGTGLYTMFQNKTRPILNQAVTTVPREKQYLAVQEPTLWPVLDRMSERIVASRCPNVGLKLPYLDYGGIEYAIWMSLQNHGFTGRIDHAFVNEEGARGHGTNPIPCVVIVTGEGPFPAALTNAFPRREEFGTSAFTRLAVHWPQYPAAARPSPPRPSP
jgi:4-amino-4-deoxy-L-arabinose transferase-like glycosyltransferase